MLGLSCHNCNTTPQLKLREHLGRERVESDLEDQMLVVEIVSLMQDRVSACIKYLQYGCLTKVLVISVPLDMLA